MWHWFSAVCVCVCVYRLDTMTLQAGTQMLAWPLLCFVHVPSYHGVQIHIQSNAHKYTHRALSLNSTAVVLETLTKVSVEASKQHNERAEKNQSTRQLTPVQNTAINTTQQLTTLGGHWAEHATCVCIRLDGNDGVKTSDNLSWLLLAAILRRNKTAPMEMLCFSSTLLEFDS